MADTAFPLTREAALRRLDDFLPEAGAAYARLRNKENGPGGHVHVSRLSAALRRRLVSEEEVVNAVVDRHGLSQAEKFVSEVFWRTYWKGWLEQRPSLWADYGRALDRAKCELEASSPLGTRYTAAVKASTGIDCFDAWVLELAKTGYLHNWARMQFASIWIFTLGLPWELGAAFMFDRLVDADPASNTLSWRWVAGLHTAGKAYLADAERIKAMTGGRYAPRDLSRTARIPADTLHVPPPSPLRRERAADPAAPTLLLLTAEDLSVEEMQDLRRLPVKAIAVLKSGNVWDQVALSDGLARASRVWPEAAVVGSLSPAEIPEAALTHDCLQVVTAFLPVGPIAEAIAPVRPALTQRGIALAEPMRDWDRRSWPHCRKGFFALKQMIPALVQDGEYLRRAAR